MCDQLLKTDFEDVCIEESDEFVVENGDVHVEESSASCHEEVLTTTTVICEASTDTIGLLESGQYGKALAFAELFFFFVLLISSNIQPLSRGCDRAGSKKTEEGGEIGKEKDCNEVCYKQRDEFGIESGNVHVEEP